MAATADQSTMLDALRLARSARTDTAEPRKNENSRAVTLTAAACLVTNIGIPYSDELVTDLSDTARIAMIQRLWELGY